MSKCTALLTVAISLLTAAAAVAQNDRDTKVHNDRRQFADAGEWVYNDLEQGVALAREQNKPLLIVLRCIP